MAWKFITASELETAALGRQIADVLQPGMTIGLVGPLGAGKTRLVKAIAYGLGVPEEDVNSPTFVLIQEYAGRLPLYHFDAYRLRDLDEFSELGADELMGSDGICLIEWANLVREALPTDTLWIEISLLSTESRQWDFSGEGEIPERAIEQLKSAFA